jgi:hypothetical protein
LLSFQSGLFQQFQVPEFHVPEFHVPAVHNGSVMAGLDPGILQASSRCSGKPDIIISSPQGAWMAGSSPAMTAICREER